jgi:hypothetical protein
MRTRESWLVALLLAAELAAVTAVGLCWQLLTGGVW